MNAQQQTGEVRMIAVDQIDVINPRERNNRVFNEIVGNIRTIGLKKPIKVTPRATADGVEKYLLVCGEGRLKAFRSLGETTIPAMVVNVSDEDAFIMSLAENIARRQCRPLELLAGIRQLQEQGYKSKVIAGKTGLTQSYVQGILILLHHGEERLVIGVEKGRIPLNAALSIVGAGDDDTTGRSAGSLRVRQVTWQAIDGCPPDYRATENAWALRCPQHVGQVRGCDDIEPGADLSA